MSAAGTSRCGLLRAPFYRAHWPRLPQLPQSKPPGARGFTLLELLVVIAIMAIASAGVILALRDAPDSQLEREAQRLAVLLDSARAQSRMTATPVRWRPTATGFAFDGLAPGSSIPTGWLGQDVRAAGAGAVLLGPEPVIGPQRIRLVSISQPTHSVTLTTDGVRPFAVLADSVITPDTP